MTLSNLTLIASTLILLFTSCTSNNQEDYTKFEQYLLEINQHKISNDTSHYIIMQSRGCHACKAPILPDLLDSLNKKQNTYIISTSTDIKDVTHYARGANIIEDSESKSRLTGIPLKTINIITTANNQIISNKIIVE